MWWRVGLYSDGASSEHLRRHRFHWNYNQSSASVLCSNKEGHPILVWENWHLMMQHCTRRSYSYAPTRLHFCDQIRMTDGPPAFEFCVHFYKMMPSRYDLGCCKARSHAMFKQCQVRAVRPHGKREERRSEKIVSYLAPRSNLPRVEHHVAVLSVSTVSFIHIDWDGDN